MNKIYYIYILILLITFSCSKKSENKTIELKILSKEIISHKNLDSMRYSNKDFRKNQNKAVFRFKISNKTNQNYCLVLRNVLNTYNGINTIEGANLDLDFLQIINKNSKDTIKVHYAYTLPMLNKKELELYEKNNKILMQQYNNLNYSKSLFWMEKNQQITNNMVCLKSNEVKYFETFVNLPYNVSSDNANYVELNFSDNYNAFLKFISDTTNIKKYLTWSQLKNIKENNYKLFHGTITSENSVPVVFVDK